MTGFTPDTATLVLNRQGGRCFWCRKWIASGVRGFDYSIHHRCPRGMGGSKEAWVNSPANALALCGHGTTGCHGWVESNRDTALDLGLLVSKIAASINPERRPDRIPVTDADGARWLLTDDGQALPA